MTKPSNPRGDARQPPGTAKAGTTWEKRPRKRPFSQAAPSGGPRHGLARVLSKQGICSRTQAAQWIVAGRVAVNGIVVRDPEYPVVRGVHRVDVDGQSLDEAPRLYVMLNKPRGLVTTARDERGRDTVYRCFDGAQLPWLAPVGRLDKASEGLLLFSNDPEWGARVTDPAHGLDKTYHVQVDTLPTPALLDALREGIADRGEWLAAKQASVLRSGTRNAWLQIVLDEGRNRQIRRLLAAHGVGVLRLVRIGVGDLLLDDLPKAGWRHLTPDEVAALSAS